MAEVLLTVSGSIPVDLADAVQTGRRPRADYRVMADRMGADVVDVDTALAGTGRAGAVLHRIGGAGPLLAWYVFRRRREYRVALTDGEQVGIPLALLTRIAGNRGMRHAMIVHVVSVPKKAKLIRLARLARRIDRWIVYCTRQSDFIQQQFGVSADKIALTTFMVDTDFFAPERIDEIEPDHRPTICSAGLERRDYPTLMRAVEGLDVDVVIAAASPWSKQADSTDGMTIPSNVTVERLDLFELRRRYAASRFVVMPLLDVDFQAGITTILEAMSMARPVVCTYTPGQTDTIIDDVTGVYVPVGDVASLRTAIASLLEDVDRCERLGRAARAWAVDHADVERYADRLAELVASL